MHLLYASYIFIALRLSRRQPVIFCVLVEAVGILTRDLCMQLEPVRLLMDKKTPSAHKRFPPSVLILRLDAGKMGQGQKEVELLG